MKKAVIITISIAVALTIAALAFVIYLNSNFLPKGRFVPDESTFDNSLNGNDLILMDDKLYYNYNGNDDLLKYGTYEIDKDGSRRVQWNGPSFSGGAPLDYFKLFKGNLLLPDISASGGIYRYNTDTQSKESFSSLKDYRENRYQSFDIIDGKMYLSTKDKLFVSSDGVNTEEIFDLHNVSPDYSVYRISDDYIVYVSSGNHIKQYNYKTKKIVLDKKLFIPDKELELEDIFLIENNIVLEYSNDFGTKIYNFSDNKMLYETGGGYYYLNDVNTCHDCLFVSVDEDGILSIDIKTGKTKKLVNGDNCYIYIFGDKWIYYTKGYDDILYRTTHDGKTTEKIFG